MDVSLAKFQSLFSTRLLVVFLLLAGVTNINAGPLNEGFVATYTLSKNDLTVANVQRRLKINNEQFIFTSYAEVAGIAALLSDETIREQSELKLQQGQLLSQLYRHDQKSKKQITSIIFNRTNNTIINTTKNQSWPLSENAFDLLGFQLGLAHTLKNNISNLSFTIVEEKRIGKHQLEILGEETLNLAGRQLKTTKIRYLDKAKKRQITFWCAQELDFIPVRIKRKDDDGDITLLELTKWHHSASQ